MLVLCGLGDSIPAEVQGRNFAPLFFDEKAEIVRPTGALYIQNVDGDKDENGLVQTYFPSSRGIKTAQYTLALYIDRDTKQLKKSLLFDDVKDPYQLHNLPLEENKEIVAQLCGEMGAMLKEINDPWYTEKIPVSYTHLTLPTNREVLISVVAVSLQKHWFVNNHAYTHHT